MKVGSRDGFRIPAEIIVAAHVTALMVGVSWAFGGNADWVRTPISICGSVGLAITVWIMADPEITIHRSTLHWAVPIMMLNLFVLASCLTPGLRALTMGKEVLLMPIRIPWWIPSAARPEMALRDLWLFDGLYFSCLNIALVVKRRAVLRALLAAVVANGLVLAVFGTVQKLSGASGIYFGSIKSPQDYFFATFVYDNHWGAFMILVTSACLGLTLRYSAKTGSGGFLRGPAPLGLLAAGVMAITVPLSGARACTILLGILLAAGTVAGVGTIRRSVRSSGTRPVPAYLVMLAIFAAAVWGAWSVTGEVVNARLAKTKEQVAVAWERGGLGARSVLYNDTWRMSRERPLFGWGMSSYPTVFGLYNTQQPNGDKIPVVYHDAHSDWLQSLSEIGFAGTFLVGLSGVLPLFAVRGKRRPVVAIFPLLGCGLIAAYALVEFPFGNVAVVLGWWLFYFASVQYIRLSES